MFPAPPFKPANATVPRRSPARRACGRTIVNAQVRPIDLQDRMKTVKTEVRGDRRPKLQRRSEEGLLQRLAVRSIVSRLPEGSRNSTAEKSFPGCGILRPRSVHIE